jgi:succinoglycan biosynthesis transport protein ExoP
MSRDLPAIPDPLPAESTQLDLAPGAGPLGPPTPRQLDVDPARKTDWRRYLAAVNRFKWIIMVVAVVGAGGGMVAGRFVDLEYEAQATIWIEPDLGAQGPIRSGQLLGNPGWIELLRSYVVLDYAVRTLRLYLELGSPGDSLIFEGFRLKETFRPGDYRLSVDESGSVLTLATIEGVVLEQAALGDSLGLDLGFAWVPPTGLKPGTRFDFAVVRPRDAARSLAGRLRTFTGRGSNFLRVNLAGSNPDLLAATVNAVIERLVEVAAELKRAKLTELATILQDQLTLAERNVTRAEAALESFRVTTITLPSERAAPVSAGLEMTEGSVMTSYFEMQVERDRLAEDRQAIDRALAQARDSGFSVDAFEVIDAVQRSTGVSQALSELTQKQADLRALRFTYTDEYSGVQQLQREVQELEQVSIPALLDDLVAELDARSAQVNERIRSASQELEEIPPRAIEEARLRRDVTVAEQIYTNLQARYEEAHLAEASSIPDVRILDPAVAPQRPSAHQGSQLILMGFIGALGIGLIGAVLFDRVDRRVRYPEQVTLDMGLQVLGVVPHFKAGANGAKPSDTASIVEAFRGIRLNLVYAHGTAGRLVVTVSSPGPGDGKSFVSANLAHAFAEAGRRTLLIDGDARRGALHRVIGGHRKPGLTDFLQGNVTRADIVQDTYHRFLSFIGTGPRMTDVPELLGSQLMAQFVNGLRTGSQYDVIIIDSPPLAAGVDAFALATVTGNLLMVLRLGISDRELAEAKLDVIDRLPVRVLGAILNDAQEGAAAYRYYSYYSYYLPGYEHAQEKDESLEDGDRPLLGTK